MLYLVNLAPVKAKHMVNFIFDKMATSNLTDDVESLLPPASKKSRQMKIQFPVITATSVDATCSSDYGNSECSTSFTSTDIIETRFGVSTYSCTSECCSGG